MPVGALVPGAYLARTGHVPGTGGPGFTLERLSSRNWLPQFRTFRKDVWTTTFTVAITIILAFLVYSLIGRIG